MCEIISFIDQKKRRINRSEALAKGKIMYYSCDSCGADIEVIDNDYPDKCPGCGLRITSWNNEVGE
ncbi:MAG: hypothetical protein E7298_06335 [Lachnospiraceae bacterium]|nr:hypothetical protein [Lachnospiraceae bacterium]